MDKTKIKILYIDDEINNLVSFKANLRDRYTVFLCKTEEEVWDVLNHNQDIRIVFCDKKMPKKDGIEMLKDIKKYYPNIIRILLSSYTNKEDVIRGINNCHIYKYIEKPFDIPEIIDIIETSNNYFLTKTNLKFIKNVSSETIELNDNKDIFEKFILINSLIREGYQATCKKINNKYKEYLLSIKDSNYFEIKENLISELKQHIS